MTHPNDCSAISLAIKEFISAYLFQIAPEIMWFPLQTTTVYYYVQRTKENPKAPSIL